MKNQSKARNKSRATFFKAAFFLIFLGLLAYSYQMHSSPSDSSGRISTEAELKQVLLTRSNQLATEISINLSPSLHEKVSQFSYQYLGNLCENCGMMSETFSYFENSTRITICDIIYFPGKRVAAWAKNNRLCALLPSEKRLYEKAAGIVDTAKKNAKDDYEVIQALNNALTQKAAYNILDLHSDNALGALLYGNAKCDGYADAFYLLCSLAGYETHYQFGYSREGGGPHMWNGVKVNGRYYFADVTWNDTGNGSDSWCMGYLLTGNDIAKSFYSWDQETALFTPAATTSSSLYYYYRENASFTSVSDAAAYIRKHRGSGPVHLMLTHNGKKPTRS